MRFRNDRVEPKGATPEEEYEALAHWLERDTGLSSSPDWIQHPAFVEIVGHGRAVLPFIVRGDLNWWKFEAIPAILGERPEIPESARGRFTEIAGIYRAWLKDKGF